MNDFHEEYNLTIRGENAKLITKNLSLRCLVPKRKYYQKTEILLVNK